MAVGPTARLPADTAPTSSRLDRNPPAGRCAWVRNVPQSLARPERRLVLDGFEALPAALVELDAAGRVRRATTTALDLLEREPGGLTGELFANLRWPKPAIAWPDGSPPSAGAAPEPPLRRLARGGRRHRAVRPPHADGRVLVLSLEDRTPTPAADGPLRALVESAPWAILAAVVRRSAATRAAATRAAARSSPPR